MILGGQFQSFTDAWQAFSISKVPKSSLRQTIGILACQETWRHETTRPQCSKGAKGHPLVHKSVWNKQTNKNSSCTISHWHLLWQCWDCVYGGTEEMKAVSRSHPPNTHNTTTWERMWRRQSFALVETAVKHMETEVKFIKILIQASYPFSSRE